MRKALTNGTLALAAASLVLTGCGSTSPAASSDGSVTVGIVGSYSGPIGSFGPAFEAGYRAGIDVLTDGTKEVDGVKIKIEVKNDNSDPTTGLAAAKELLGEGVRIIVGPASSAVVVPVAQLALQNNALFIAGTTGTADIDGMGKGIYRSAVTPAAQMRAVLQAAKDNGDKSLMYIGQDYAYGQGQEAALKSQSGDFGVSVQGTLLPVETQDFTAGVAKALAAGTDSIFIGWAGEGQPQLFKALSDQGAFDRAHVMAVAPARPDFDAYGTALGANVDKTEIISTYAENTMDTEADRALNDALAQQKEQPPVDLQQAAGYFAAQLTVQAIKDAGSDLAVDAVDRALEAARFDTPVGEVMVRADDHVPLFPVFSYKMVKDGSHFVLQLDKTFDAEVITPAPTKTVK